LSVLTPEPQNYKALVEKVRFLETNGKRKNIEIEKLRTQLIAQITVGEKVEELERGLQEMRMQLKEIREKKV